MHKQIGQSWGKDHFSVYGGSFDPERWLEFLAAWHWPKEEKRWGVWEFISSFIINGGEFPSETHISLLERVELFGESGHVSSRRDEQCVYWHFVGKPEIAIPQGFDEQFYWDAHPNDVFKRSTRSAMLWGERVNNTDLWHDDRVARARLSYPGASALRAQAKYWQFTQHGQLAFVWVSELADY